MADQGRWFKLWCSALTDPHLDNLSIEDFGRWAKLATHIKEQGVGGSIVIESPARAVCSMLQVDDFDALLICIKRLPNVTVTGETNVTVTFDNWQRYQGDNSLHRVRRFRANVTPKKRREEKRKEEMKRSPHSPPEPGVLVVSDFDAFWEAYPRRIAKEAARKAWAKLKPDPALASRIIQAVRAQSNSSGWRKEDGKFIPYPATWLNGRRWEDALEGVPDPIPLITWEPGQ